MVIPGMKELIRSILNSVLIPLKIDLVKISWRGEIIHLLLGIMKGIIIIISQLGKRRDDEGSKTENKEVIMFKFYY